MTVIIMGLVLRHGVTFCRVDDRFVFLDLPRDRYFCLGRSATEAFDRLVSGSTLDRHAGHAFAGLIADGLLLVVPGSDRPLPCRQLPAADTLLREESRPMLSTAAVEALARRLSARCWLRFAGLQATIESVRPHHVEGGAMIDRRVAVTASAAFSAAALASAPGAMCLSISIATMRWLSARGCAATLAIGVKLQPFQAHCWVQLGNELVNDEIDTVRNFVPVLVV